MKKYVTTLALIILALASQPAWGAPTDLYRITDREPVFRKEVAAIADVVDEVEVSLDTSAIDKSPSVLTLELPDGRQLTVSRSRFDVQKGYLTWVGEATVVGDGTSGYVHLVDHGDRVSGILNIGSDRYQIVATSLGEHRLVRIQARDGKTCLLAESAFQHIGGRDFESEDWESLLPDLKAAEAGSRSEPDNFSTDEGDDGTEHLNMPTKSTSMIDVLAVYPQSFSGSAETAARDFIQTSVSIANDVFFRSNVNAQYRLIEMVKLSGTQPPTTGLLDNWDWINTDPQEVLDLRDGYSADMVALFIPLSYNADNYCGVANLPTANGGIVSQSGPFEDRAFTVHRSGCGLTDYTFAHELGHNFGMRHDNEGTSSSTYKFPYGRGHILGFNPWQANANGSLETDVPGDFAVGYHFTPLTDGYVSSLGGLFNGVRTVKLFDKASGQLLRSASVSSSNQWAYQSISPIYVEAGTTYTVAVYLTGSGGSVYSNVTLFPQTYDNVIRIEGSTAISTLSDPNARPTNTVTDVMYGQVDIRFEPYATVMGCIREPGGDITGAVCNRIPYFSDPSISYQGFVTGTTDRNNAAVARLQIGPYSQFRTNNAPVAVNDYLTTPQDTRLSIPLGLILGNDYDPDGHSISLYSYDSITAQGGTNDSGHVGGFNYTPPPGFAGTDWFMYTIEDTLGAQDTGVVYVDVTANEVVIGEVGKVTNLTHAPQTVTFSRTYSNPVVFAQPPSQNGSNASVVRITNVSSSSFTFYVHEAPNLDGIHTTETVSYLVVEAGSWKLADGTELRAGKLNTSATVGQRITNQWATAGYGGAFPAAPVILSQVQTNNDPTWVKTRNRSVTTSSFQVALEKEEASLLIHPTETVGWVAMSPASGTWSGRPYVASRTGNAVTDAWYPVSFSQSVGSAPHFLAAMSTFDGSDSAELRYRNLSGSSVEVRVEEDTTYNSEVAHTTEVIDYLVVGGAGTLEASAN